MSDNDTIGAIYDRIWLLSPYHTEPKSYEELKGLTKQLIEAYRGNDRLDNDPFLATSDRKIIVDVNKLSSLLKGQVCLITGGYGCVGSCLVEKLLELDIKALIIFDKKRKPKGFNDDERIIFVNGNICDEDSLKRCFDEFRPGFVFHTAAQRNPGYAEKHVLEVVRENIFGTLNLVQICENSSFVKQCVFSSTGKASRYYTSEVYAATKKICEFIFDTHAKNSKVLYSMVRFTHIINNSLMNFELKNIEEADYIAIHSPGKYVTAQSVSEAASLMLNSLIYAERNRSVFLIVKNLEWPVESLEVALYNISKHRHTIPVIFTGNPPGYQERFFRGQLDWSAPQSLNLLINVYENQNIEFNSEQDMIISKILSVSKKLLLECLSGFHIADNDFAALTWLKDVLYRCVGDSLKNVDTGVTLNILKWGLDPNYNPMNDSIAGFKEIIQLLMKSLSGTPLEKLAENLVSR